MLPIFPAAYASTSNAFFLRAKQAPLNSYKITIGFLRPFIASHRAQRGSITPIYKLLYIRNKSIALLCQITSKKLQISFVQNTETLID